MVKGDEDTITLYNKVKRDHTKIFQTGHQYHSSRLYAHIVEMIQAGEIGKVSAVHAQWNRNGIGEDRYLIQNLSVKLTGECIGSILMA